jgi:serine/arginine repetitive matrix protein 2
LKQLNQFCSWSVDRYRQPEHVPITPLLQAPATAWTKSPFTFPVKESTSRAPDPEHLKIVWSKSETKDELPSINSLEGIADDFTTVPFTIQDVKSEDGETPPPTAPSRMSLSEVTRAFQQVPSRPDSTHPRSNQLSSTLSSPGPATNNRPQSFGLPPTPQASTRTLSYGSYQSPIMSHSPAPVMYTQGLTPSPVPGRMMVNGHSPQYAQPLWMPIPAGPAGQNPGSMIRPLHSPFPAQVMSYPSPGSMYAPPMTNGHNHIPQPNGLPQGRGRGGVPMMSPVISPVNPSAPHPNMMYPASPVMLPAPPVMSGYPPPPLAVGGGGRGQLRDGYDGMQPPPMSGPAQPATYAPMPSYVRPAW